MKEIEEVEVQELTYRGEIARYLQRLEELDDQVGIFYIQFLSTVIQ
jgi:hypothetical protein